MGLVADLSPDLAPLWRAVHERLASGLAVTSIKVGPLQPAQRAALADLLGLGRLPAERATIPLRRLDQVLLESVGADARGVVSELLGPPGNRAAQRVLAATERADLWAWLDSHPAVTAQPALAAWARSMRQSGMIGSVERTRMALTEVLTVLAELPADGLPLPVLADRALGDSHGLDDGTRCSGLVMRALSAIFDTLAPRTALERRALWERAGVSGDELSNAVLAAGFWPTGDDIACQILRACASTGQAAVLTLGHLRASDLNGHLPDVTWVFENPSMLARALARFGCRCPPVVITSGWPNSAAIALLGKLAAAGTELRYHGDFDGEGVRIAAAVAARTGAIPWRMSSADYLAAVDVGPRVGRVSEAPWDAELAGHLLRIGISVSEERVGEDLLNEIGAALDPPG